MLRSNIYKSAIIGLTEELVAVISGFILPRMILSYFGSSYNGLISAVTQFIGCIALLKSGIGMATKAALYQPLYVKDTDKINGIMSATMRFLRKVAVIFVFGIICFAAVYPFVIKEEFSWYFSFTLVLITSLGTFFQYYFGLGNQLLLEADQKYYIVSLISMMNVILNTIVSVVCMKAGFSIHGVKLCSSVVYCTSPVLLHYYVKKVYKIDSKAKPDWESISKRWDAFGMQIANFVNSNTDIIIASLFLELKEVSVYTIYYLAINGIKKFINRIVVGVEAALGNLIAQNDKKKLKSNFIFFEFILNLICVFMFSCLIVLIVPFVNVYTHGISDVNYSRTTFAIVACVAELFYCLRLPYTFLVQATGRFAETKKFSYIEAGINIVSSLILVNVIGLNGIVLGTLLAMIYRTFVFAKYVYENIIVCKLKYFYFRVFITISCIFINYYIGTDLIVYFKIENYYQWCTAAIIVAVAVAIMTLIVHIIVYKKMLMKLVRVFFKKIRK